MTVMVKGMMVMVMTVMVKGMMVMVMMVNDDNGNDVIVNVDDYEFIVRIFMILVDCEVNNDEVHTNNKLFRYLLIRAREKDAK